MNDNPRPVVGPAGLPQSSDNSRCGQSDGPVRPIQSQRVTGGLSTPDDDEPCDQCGRERHCCRCWSVDPLHPEPAADPYGDDCV